jgi:hypothetical protein
MEPQIVIDQLLRSNEPSISYLCRRDVLEEDPASDPMLTLQEQVRASERVEKMLSPRGEDGRFPWHAYDKWIGAFWTLLLLSDIGYPAGDLSLVPLRDQVLSWLLSEQHIKKVPLINGRWRRCACQEGSIVLAMLKLDIADDRITLLVDNLLNWQWPDGGWNCDKKPAATHSSFHETWLPLRAMQAYAKATGSSRATESVEKASEVFLSHHLYMKKSDPSLILEEFTHPAYPAYWHYDYLVGLKVMGEVGRLSDPRCRDALDLLETTSIPDGGFRAEKKYYRVTDKVESSGVSFVDWGGASKQRMNEWVTVSALSVLKKSGRLAA